MSSSAVSRERRSSNLSKVADEDEGAGVVARVGVVVELEDDEGARLDAVVVVESVEDTEAAKVSDRI